MGLPLLPHSRYFFFCFFFLFPFGRFHHHTILIYNIYTRTYNIIRGRMFCFCTQTPSLRWMRRGVCTFVPTPCSVLGVRLVSPRAKNPENIFIFCNQKFPTRSGAGARAGVEPDGMPRLRSDCVGWNAEGYIWWMPRLRFPGLACFCRVCICLRAQSILSGKWGRTRTPTAV